MSTKVEHKRVEELENYDITKAAEDDVLLIVGTNDGNKSGKIPVSEFRDQMAKISVINLVVMVISFLESIMKGKNNETFHIATAFDVAAKYIKTNWFDFSTGTPNQTYFQALKSALASAVRQISDDAVSLLNILFPFGRKDLGYYYIGRTTKAQYRYTAPQGSPQPDTVYVVHWTENDIKCLETKTTLEGAQTEASIHPGATIEEADWAGGADKQPFVFDWTKDRIADRLDAMDMEEFLEGLEGLLFSFTKDITKIYSYINSMSDQIWNLANRVAALEQALSQFQNSGNGEDAALRNRVEALWAQFVGTDASNMTTEEMVAALENGANITPDPNATLAKRIEALEALAAQQQ